MPSRHSLVTPNVSESERSCGFGKGDGLGVAKFARRHETTIETITNQLFSRYGD